jgi:ribosome biogenesis GTPase
VDGDLRALGWDDDLAMAAREFTGVPGRVARVDRGAATVLTADEPLRAATDTALRRDERPDGGEGDVAVGDWVVVDDAPEGGLAVVAVLPRRSAFVRGAARERSGIASDAQVLATNIDTVFVVQSLVNGPNLRRLERELVLSWQSGATPVVVLTKHDLVDDDSAVAHAVAGIERIATDVPVIVTSAVTDEGIDAVAQYATHGRTVALIGASGVGKSTLVNRLVGHDVQATSEVREGDQRGRHTTVARELVPLPGGGVLVDTPGLRAVSLWDADEGIERAFADVEELATGCRFADCRHEQEPGCAVKAAVDDGRLDAARLASYQRLVDELDQQARDAEERAWKQRDRGPRRRR